MPFTMLAFFLASLSIIGLPPFGGLWSKWLILQGGLASDQLFVVIVLMLASLLSVAYLLPISIRAFITPTAVSHTSEKKELHQIIPETAIKEAPVTCLIAIAISVAACLWLFFYSTTIYNLLGSLVGKLL